MTTRNSKNRIDSLVAAHWSRRIVSRRAGLGVCCASQCRGSGPIVRSPPVVQGIYRGLSPVVKFDVSPPLRDMKPILGPGQLRENEDRDILPWKVSLRSGTGPGCAESHGR